AALATGLRAALARATRGNAGAPGRSGPAAEEQHAGAARSRCGVLGAGDPRGGARPTRTEDGRVRRRDERLGAGQALPEFHVLLGARLRRPGGGRRVAARANTSVRCAPPPAASTG